MANRRDRAAGDTQPIDPSRRRVLAKLGAFAVYTAPAMTTLLVAGEARATHKLGHIDACVGPNPPPQCNIDPCAGASPPPFCNVGSMGSGPEAGAFAAPADDFYESQDAPADGGWDSAN